MNEELILKMLSENPEKVLKLLDAELSLPNIPLPTMGGEVWWTDIAEYDGWRIQQNSITHHARILDPSDVRRAWGTINGMNKAFQRIVSGFESTASRENKDKDEAYDRLLKLKHLYDEGVLSEEEYQNKKAQYINEV